MKSSRKSTATVLKSSPPTALSSISAHSSRVKDSHLNMHRRRRERMTHCGNRVTGNALPESQRTRNAATARARTKGYRGFGSNRTAGRNFRGVVGDSPNVSASNREAADFAGATYPPARGGELPAGTRWPSSSWSTTTVDERALEHRKQVIDS